MNRWNIPNWLEREVRARDVNCIYCGIEMTAGVPRGHTRRRVATWEHIINDVRIVTRENIALCCSACNSSKGAKPLAQWLKSDYCAQRGITEDRLADVARAALGSDSPANVP